VSLRLALIANFSVPHSTGNDLKDTLEGMGAAVSALQEEDENSWRALITAIRAGNGPGAVIWNRTPTLAARIPLDTRLAVLETAKSARIPTIAFHLDRWWGLKREHELFDDPYFRCQYVFTADGHDPARWEAAGIAHFWSPPAIAPRNCARGVFQPRLRSEIAFIGTWWRYHEEWSHRADLIRWLKRYYGKRFTVVPRRGTPQVRGAALNDLLASVDVVVGDSCLVPDGFEPYTHYCSDRMFEIPGRGGFLVHPGVQGVCWWPAENNLMVPGTHIGSWTLGDWTGMRRQVNYWLERPGDRQVAADAAFEHVRRFHTYQHRLQRVFDIVGLELS
jgi:Glycosyl transferases group 1